MTKRDMEGGGAERDRGRERQMGDTAKWIQHIHADFDKWQSDTERHSNTHTLYFSPSLAMGLEATMIRCHNDKMVSIQP